jgi:hypothetical protein
MMEKTRTIDQGNKYLKLLLRKAMLSRIQPQTALDLFAGRGDIARVLYQGFEELHCVERDTRKFAALEKNLSKVQGPRIHLHRMNNRLFLQNMVKEIPRINLVDFDAYGSPNLQVKTFFAHYRLEGPTLIFATDSGKISCQRGRRFSPDLYSSCPGTNPGGTGYNPVLVHGYEKLIRQFWFEMAKAHRFRIELFKILWKKRRLVAYYGLLISPR